MSKKNRNKTVNKSLSEDENIDQLSENAKSESESSDHHNEDAEEEEATTSSEEDSVTNIPGQAPAPPASSFSELGVNQWLVDALAAVAIRKPTEIQRACIRPTLEGRTIIGGARTGSGKTVAFAVPILQKLAEDPYGVFAVVLTPTRELAFQIADQFNALGSGVNLKMCVAVGGMDMTKQALELSRRPHVIVATPGRLADHINSSSGAIFLKRVKFLVLDEADRLLTPSFAPDLNVIMDQLPRDRQTLLYTATLTEAIFALQHSAHTDEKRPPPFVYRCDSGIATVATLRQRYLLVPSHVREVYLTLLLRATSAKEDEEEDEDEPSEKRQQLDKAMKRMRLDPKRNKKHDKDKKSKDKTTAVTRKPVVLDPMVSEARSVIVFTGHCRTAEILRIMLTELGVSCAALHSMLSQRARLASLGQFKSRLVRVLIATDVGSRGLDIPTVDLVINYDVPRDPADYIHRVGRTARAGRSGAAITIMAERDVMLVKAIEERIGVKLEEFVVPEEHAIDALNQVTKAKREAVMQLHGSAFGQKHEIRKRKQQMIELLEGKASSTADATRKKSKTHKTH